MKSQIPSKRTGVILGTQRSGTTALGRALGAEQDIAYVGEIFHGIRGPQDEVNYQRYLTEPAANFFTFKESLVSKFPALVYPSPENQRTIWDLYTQNLFSLGEELLWVIDVKYNSLHHLNSVWQDPLDWPGLLGFLASEKTPVLHLVREDLFSQAVSTEIAVRTNRWHSFEPVARGEPLVFDPRKIEGTMRSQFRTQRHVRNLLRSYPQAIELRYEQALPAGQLSDAVCTAIRKLFNLDHPIAGITDLQKIINTPLAEWIANPEEIREHFSGNEFEKYIVKHLG
jgi:LPS sulfotransferase NodH